MIWILWQTDNLSNKENLKKNINTGVKTATLDLLKILKGIFDYEIAISYLYWNISI